MTPMLRLLRILTGIGVIGLLLGVASWAVRDCGVAPYAYENCAWLDMRDAFALPQSKLLRALLLQAIGLSLAGGMYFTWRYILPRRERAAGPAATETTPHR